MRHNVKGRKLGRTTEHRQAMFRNQLASLVASGRIVTTLMKAKELRPLAEKVVTKGKRGSVDARRQVRRWIAQRELVKKLFDEVAPRFQDRNGGYTRILKLGPRPGDGAEMAILEFVDFKLDTTEKKSPAKADKVAKGKAEAAEGEEPQEGGKKPAKRAAAKPAPKAPVRKAPKADVKSHAAPKKRSTPRKAGSE